MENDTQNKKLWFKAKKFGWGWYPASWQGWLITIVYIGVILALALSLDEGSTNKETVFVLVIPLILLTITFIRIAYRTGEKPEWRWGK